MIAPFMRYLRGGPISPGGCWTSLVRALSVRRDHPHGDVRTDRSCSTLTDRAGQDPGTARLRAAAAVRAAPVRRRRLRGGLAPADRRRRRAVEVERALPLRQQGGAAR